MLAVNFPANSTEDNEGSESSVDADRASFAAADRASLGGIEAWISDSQGRAHTARRTVAAG